MGADAFRETAHRHAGVNARLAHEWRIARAVVTVAPGVFAPVRAARRFFPLRLGGQAPAGPGGEGGGLLRRHPADRVAILPPLDDLAVLLQHLRGYRHLRFRRGDELFILPGGHLVFGYPVAVQVDHARVMFQRIARLFDLEGGGLHRHGFVRAFAGGVQHGSFHRHRAGALLAAAAHLKLTGGHVDHQAAVGAVQAQRGKHEIRGGRTDAEDGMHRRGVAAEPRVEQAGQRTRDHVAGCVMLQDRLAQVHRFDDRRALRAAAIGRGLPGGVQHLDFRAGHGKAEHRARHGGDGESEGVCRRIKDQFTAGPLRGGAQRYVGRITYLKREGLFGKEGGGAGQYTDQHDAAKHGGGPFHGIRQGERRQR
ncbi:MAG: hypothetical protein BWY76_01572 [bacterium ADurb.Bin429]|nr:MAG: hypothetical protein BWY76_01572 [bacterium ADurb.Bin429]